MSIFINTAEKNFEIATGKVYQVVPTTTSFLKNFLLDSSNLFRQGIGSYNVIPFIISMPSFLCTSDKNFRIATGEYVVQPLKISFPTFRIGRFYPSKRGFLTDSVLVEKFYGVEFTAEPRRGDKPLLVEFFPNLPEYATLIEWDFGDGETSSDLQPIHLYLEGGSFEVKLTASLDLPYENPIVVGVSKALVVVSDKDVVGDFVYSKTRDSIFKEKILIKQKYRS